MSIFERFMTWAAQCCHLAPLVPCSSQNQAAARGCQSDRQGMRCCSGLTTSVEVHNWGACCHSVQPLQCQHPPAAGAEPLMVVLASNTFNSSLSLSESVEDLTHGGCVSFRLQQVPTAPVWSSPHLSRGRSGSSSDSFATVMSVRCTCLHCLQARREQREERKRQRLEESQKESQEDPALLQEAVDLDQGLQGTQLFPELPSAQQVD